MGHWFFYGRLGSWFFDRWLNNRLNDGFSDRLHDWFNKRLFHRRFDLRFFHNWFFNDRPGYWLLNRRFGHWFFGDWLFERWFGHGLELGLGLGDSLDLQDGLGLDNSFFHRGRHFGFSSFRFHFFVSSQEGPAFALYPRRA
ncbi:MAG: hypothetical protein WAY02_05665 [Burkholderiaceae bacterium]